MEQSIFSGISKNIQWIGASFGFITTDTIDAAAEKVFLYGSVYSPDWTSGSKDITEVILVPATVTQGTGTTVVQVGLSDIALGTPPRDDGTLDQSGSIAMTNLTASIAATITLDAARTVNIGDRFGVVVEFSEFGTGPALILRSAQAELVSNGISGYIGTPAWASRSGTPNVTFVCSDSSRLYFKGAVGGFLSQANDGFNSGSTGTTITGGDERGNRWIPSGSWDITGITAVLRATTADADVDLVLYRDTTVLWSQTVLGDELASTTQAVWMEFPFTSSIRVNAGENIYFTQKPTTGNNVTVMRHNFYTVADKQAFLGGVTAESDVCVVNRVDTGSWNVPTDADKSIYVMELLGNPRTPSQLMVGPHIVSGTIALNSDGSSPVSGAMVRIIRQSDNGVLQTTSGISGSYSFSVASGSVYHVVAEYISGSQRHNWRSLFDITASAP